MGGVARRGPVLFVGVLLVVGAAVLAACGAGADILTGPELSSVAAKQVTVTDVLVRPDGTTLRVAVRHPACLTLGAVSVAQEDTRAVVLDIAVASMTRSCQASPGDSSGGAQEDVATVVLQSTLGRRALSTLVGDVTRPVPTIVVTPTDVPSRIADVAVADDDETLDVGYFIPPCHELTSLDVDERPDTVAISARLALVDRCPTGGAPDVQREVVRLLQPLADRRLLDDSDRRSVDVVISSRKTTEEILALNQVTISRDGRTASTDVALTACQQAALTSGEAGRDVVFTLTRTTTGRCTDGSVDRRTVSVVLNGSLGAQGLLATVPAGGTRAVTVVRG